MEADFSGYATKAGLKCSDGRTIMPGAFQHQDKVKVPLVWQHGHNDPENVLGHAVLENRPDGVYAHGYFNKSQKANHAHGLLEHDDINMMSIWANDLIERSGRVLHGMIREVSLVLSGANPGALIENVTLRHSDGDEMVLEHEAIIYTGIPIDVKHSDKEEEVSHADDATDEETVQDVYDSMSAKQKEVLHFMVGQAFEANDSMGQDNLNDDTDKEGDKMVRHNVFENGDKKESGPVISHADVKGIVSDATKSGSLKEAVENYALSHGIEDIDILFPEARSLTNTPEFFTRRVEWVNGVLSGARKSPFSRIKTVTADLTFEEARAKGYITGTMKKEEFFGVAKRVTTPQTIYKKQKLDRDDIIDITDFDVVTWMKTEMRLMLDEELARAILIGDGRDVADEDKIQEGNIRPIASDDGLYVTTVNVNIADASSSVQEIVDAIVMARSEYRGSGTPTLYTTEKYIAQFLLLKDSLGRRIYSSLDQLASELRVTSVVPVEAMEDVPNVMGIIVNMSDYVIGADKGGNVSLFDDFDIDYNQYKYLIETRCSGALVKLKSALVIKTVAASDTLVVPSAPTFDEATNNVTIPSVTGVEYVDEGGAVLPTSGNPYHLDPQESMRVTARAKSGKYFATSADTTWTFKNKTPA